MSTDEKPIASHMVHTTVHDIFRTRTLIIREKLEYEDGRIVPNTRVIVQPVRDFYITNPKYQTYVFKREKEAISRLDRYTCRDSELEIHLAKALNMHGRIFRRKLINHRYVYGADIDIESLFKMQYYNRNRKRTPPPLSIGFLDIEANPRTSEICLISVTPNQKSEISVFIHKGYMKKELPDGTIKPISLEDIKSKVRELIGQELEEHGYTVKYILCDGEADVLTKTFECLHGLSLDYVAIWNLDYDVPTMLRRMAINKLDPADLLSDPRFPKKLRFWEYRKDYTKRDHYIQKWHWLHAPSEFKFIDSMCLYGWNRRTQGFESSYSLSNMLRKHLKSDKLFNVSDHYEFQRTRFDTYVAYNIMDTFRFYLLEEQIKDITRMQSAASLIPLDQFAYTTIRIRNEYYYFYKKFGYIIGSSEGKINLPGEDKLRNVGGTVLSPENVIGGGLRIISEDPTLATLFFMMANDADFSSIYPTIMRAFNISNETHILTMTRILGKYRIAVHDYASRICFLNECIMNLMEEYYSLPNYTRLYSGFNRFLRERTQ